MAFDPWRAYFYPGTRTLINSPGLRDARELAQFERTASAARFVELRTEPVPLTFDVSHFKAIHRRLFQDVYPWAGEFRLVEMQKDETVFAPLRSVAHPSLESWGQETLKRLEADRFLRGLTKEAFVAKLAGHFREINYWHPFRDGNGRTTRLFLLQLAEGAGYTLDFSQTDSHRWNEASRVAEETNEVAPLRTVFRAIATPLRARAFAEALETRDAREAVRAHPELSIAFETLDQARTLLGGTLSERSAQNRYEAMVTHLKRRLESGYPPAPLSRETTQTLLNRQQSLSR